MGKTSLSLLVFLLSSLLPGPGRFLSAQVSAPPADAEKTATDALLGVDPSSPLGKALAAFDWKRYKKELFWWACDERDGRETGTKGAREAREWALARFREFGLRPMGEVVRGKRSYIQTFPIQNQMRNRVDPAKAVFKLGKKALVFLKDWAFLGGWRKAEVKNASLVFAGYGLKDEDMVRAGVKGKVLVLREGTPEKPLDMVHDSRPGWLKTFLGKAARAARFGALALILVPSPGKERPLFTEHQDLVRWRSRGCPVVQISNEKAESLLKRLTLRKDRKTGVFKGIRVTMQFAADKTRLGRNLIGLWKGSDPALSGQYVVIGAHRDHIGIGAYGSRARRQRGEIHNGADDNATGAVGVIEIARALARAGYHPRRSILFMLFDAEEMGLLGSRWWVKHPTVPIKRVVAMINMDMIGRVRDKKCLVMGSNTSAAWGPALRKATARSPLEWEIRPSGFGGSDHLPFMRAGIPVIFFHSGLHPDYHTPQDDPEKCNPKGAVEALKVLLYTADLMANASRPPKFQASPSRSGGSWRRYVLGVVLRQTNDGPEVRDVAKGSLAERLGIRKGDILLSIAGRKVRRISDVFRRLRRAWRTGKVEVSWSRAGKIMTKTGKVKK